MPERNPPGSPPPVKSVEGSLDASGLRVVRERTANVPTPVASWAKTGIVLGPGLDLRWWSRGGWDLRSLGFVGGREGTTGDAYLVCMLSADCRIGLYGGRQPGARPLEGLRPGARPLPRPRPTPQPCLLRALRGPREPGRRPPARLARTHAVGLRHEWGRRGLGWGRGPRRVRRIRARP